MKHSTPEEDMELANLLSQFPHTMELVYRPDFEYSSDTSTPEGQAWRKWILAVKDEENYLGNLWRLYRQTGNKKYLVAINNITDAGDNLPQDDN